MLHPRVHAGMAIEDRLKRVVASKTTEYVVDYLTADEREELEQAREEAREAQLNALARAAANNSSNSGSGGASSPVESGVIDDMMEEEDCPVCRSILAAVSEMDEPRRTRGIAEYGSFRTASNISEEKAIEVLENSEILKDALEDVQQVRP